jgi:lipopolysaccharide export system protein LptA
MFNNVVLLNEKDNNRISGDYGEVLYNEDIYTVEGNTVYSDGEIEITSDKISTYKGEETTFSGSVQYSDGDFEIKAPVLSIISGEAAFKEKSEAMHVESGDRIYCGTISFNTKTGDAVFMDDVLYVQNEEEGEDPLLMRSDTTRFFQESDTYLFLGNVFVINEHFTAQSSVARYIRGEGVLNVSGNIVLQEGNKYTYCTNANYDESTEKTVLYNKVNGILFDTMK